jgi:hypothetical protein
LSTGGVSVIRRSLRSGCGRGHEALRIGQDRAPRKERRGVRIRAQAQEHEIESRNRRSRRGEDAAQLLLVQSRGTLGIGLLTAHAMHVLGQNRNVAQEALERHVVVAVGMIRRHASLVTPEHVRSLPVDGRRGAVVVGRPASELLVERARRRSARQRDDEPPAILDRVRGRGREALGAEARERSGVLGDEEPSAAHRTTVERHVDPLPAPVWRDPAPASRAIPDLDSARRGVAQV